MDWANKRSEIREWLWKGNEERKHELLVLVRQRSDKARERGGGQGKNKRYREWMMSEWMRKKRE